ncbi:MAG: hypothetical protein ACI8PV_000803, partial [Dinoroseobacter sp.]
MNESIDIVSIETDEFIFEAPEGYSVEVLDDQAELAGPNDEFLVVSSYSVDQDSSEQALKEFTKNVCDAMLEAAAEPDLRVSGKLKQEVSPSDFPVWSLLSEATDKSHFFDQYAAVQGTTSVLVTIEGNF